MVDYIKAVIDLYVPAGEETDELEGQGMVEYGLILALVSIVAIAALIALGGSLSGAFNTVTGAIGGAGGSGSA